MSAKEKSGARRVIERRDLVYKQDIVCPIEMPSISASRPRGEECTHALDVVRDAHFGRDKVEQEHLERLSSAVFHQVAYTARLTVLGLR